MTRYSMEPRAKKYVKGYGLFSFARNFPNKYRKQLLDISLAALKTTFKKVVHKKGYILGNIMAEAVTNSYNDKFLKTKPAEEVTIPPEEREEIWNKLRQVL